MIRGVILCAAISAQAAFAQDVLVYGRVREHEKPEAIIGASIVIIREGSEQFTLRSDSTGYYSIALDVGLVWRIRFEAPGRASKLVEFDLRDTPKFEGGYGSNVDIRLFLNDPDLDLKFLEEPIGRCRYVEATANIAWDMAYTAPRMQRLAALKPIMYEVNMPDTIPK